MKNIYLIFLCALFLFGTDQTDDPKTILAYSRLALSNQKVLELLQSQLKAGLTWSSEMAYFSRSEPWFQLQIITANKKKYQRILVDFDQNSKKITKISLGEIEYYSGK